MYSMEKKNNKQGIEMDPNIASAPTHQFARKAYFWRLVNLLRTQTGLPVNVGYRNFSATQLEDEYMRLAKRQVQQKVARQATWALQERSQKILKKKMKEVAQQTTKAAQTRGKRIARKQEEGNIQMFFRNPQPNKEIEITHLSMRDVVPFIALAPGYTLLLNAGSNYWTVNNDNITQIIDALSAEVIDINNEDYNEVIYNVVNNPNITTKFIWRQAGRRRPNGGYFKYYHKMDKIDLSRYGIYRHESETDEYRLNCLEIAFNNAGIDESKFNKLKTLIKTRYVPQKDLKIVADHLQVCIVLCKLDSHNNTIYYGSKDNQKINIGLIDEHYFLIEKTNYTSFSIKKYFEVSSKGTPLNCEENFNKICKKEGTKYKRREDRFISSYDVIKLLLANKDTHLENITMGNCGTFSQYSNRTSEYTDLPDIGKNEAKLCKPKELNRPEIFLNIAEMKVPSAIAEKKKLQKKIYHDYDVLYFDTESTTNEESHKPFMIRSKERNGEKKHFDGNHCILKWLQSLDKNYICIAHNLRYDFQFIVRWLSQADNPIKTGNKIKSVSGKFYNRNTGKTILLHFKDSCGLIPMPLREFGKCFNLKVRKEVIPYEAYNSETVKQSSIGIDYAASFLPEADKKEYFMKNIEEWGLKRGDGHFDHMEYSRNYCAMDVEVLQQGYEMFRGWMMDVCQLDIDNAVSLPQLAHTFGLASGVFQGCYKIAGVPRDFIQKCVVGGRCMTRQNQQFKINHEVDDFDGVSLYPSAMNRMEGYLKGLPKVLTPALMRGIEQDPSCASGFANKLDGYFVEINVKNVGKYRDFPLLSRVNDRGIREFKNDIRGPGIFVDKTSLEDLVRFQCVEYEVVRGYYFNEGRNPKIKEFMAGLFQERLVKKAAKNPIQRVYKEIMNSFYGRQIMKPIEYNHSFVYGKEKFEKHLQYKFNSISQYTQISDGLYFVKEARSIVDHFSMPHCGVEVLSMSKRIMNEVMCLAEDIGIEIYYQDTDSMHIDARRDDAGSTGVEKLAVEFEKLYDRQLVGNNLGQFHSDFDFKSDVAPISVESIYLGKKSYIDRVRVVNLSPEEEHVVDYKYHMRMKGIPSETLKDEVKKNYDNDSIKMYSKLLRHEPITFDLLRVCKFKTNNNFTTSNNKEFTRTLQF